MNGDAPCVLKVKCRRCRFARKLHQVSQLRLEITVQLLFELIRRRPITDITDPTRLKIQKPQLQASTTHATSDTTSYTMPHPQRWTRWTMLNIGLIAFGLWFDRLRTETRSQESSKNIADTATSPPTSTNTSEPINNRAARNG